MSRFIQIATTSRPDMVVLFALDDEGAIWVRLYDTDKGERWVRMLDVRETPDAPRK